MYAVNVDGTAGLMAACAAAGVRRLVYTSTIGTVGHALASAIDAHSSILPDETAPFDRWDQASHYVRSKYLSELTAVSWDGVGLEVVVVKPTAPVGAGDARPSATGRRILAALRGEVQAYPPGGVNHAPVRDIAIAHLLAALNGKHGESYILGHCQGNLHQTAFLRMVADAAGAEPSRPLAVRAPRGAAARASGSLPDALTANPLKAVTELGMPQSDLMTAFAESVAWYQARGLDRVGR
jgi:dihydroflavonol-4-reductase